MARSALKKDCPTSVCRIRLPRTGDGHQDRGMVGAIHVDSGIFLFSASASSENKSSSNSLAPW